MITSADTCDLIARWWYVYDNAQFDDWPSMFTRDARFTCRTDTGATAYEEFVTVDVSGRDAVVAWQTEHRLASPYPLRHCAENVHLTSATGTEATFRSYIWVTQIVGGTPSALSTAIVDGRVALEDDELCIAELNVVLDTEESTPLADRRPSR